MTWNESCRSLTRSDLIIVLILFAAVNTAKAQQASPFQELRFLPSSYERVIQNQEVLEFPDPKMVMHRSMIIPGWGQITNRQVWKVPIVYGLLGGLTYYSIYLTKQYHDYRAAFYNLSNSDKKFGETPLHLVGVSQGSLESNRNFLRNRRDFIYVTIGLAYVLNVVDAYVFAHLRSFDVSDDLSLNTRIKPDIIPVTTLGDVPSVSISFSLSK